MNNFLRHLRNSHQRSNINNRFNEMILQSGDSVNVTYEQCITSDNVYGWKCIIDGRRGTIRSSYCDTKKQALSEARSLYMFIQPINGLKVDKQVCDNLSAQSENNDRKEKEQLPIDKIYRLCYDDDDSDDDIDIIIEDLPTAHFIQHNLEILKLDAQSDTVTTTAEQGDRTERVVKPMTTLIENRDKSNAEPMQVTPFTSDVRSFTMDEHVFPTLTSRFNNIGTFDWTTAQTRYSIIDKIDLPYDLFRTLQTNPAFLPLLQHSFVRPNITVRYQLNSTNFHSGLLVVGAIYYSKIDSQQSVGRIPVDARQITSLDFARLNAASSNIAELKIPFQSFFEMIPIRSGLIPAPLYYVSVYVGVLSPLAIGEGGTPHVTVTKFVSLECDGEPTKFYGQTCSNKVWVDAQSDVISEIGQLVPMVGNALEKGSNLVSEVIRPLENLFSGVGTLFKSRNDDRPSDPKEPIQVILSPNTNLSHGVGVVEGRVLRLDPTAITPHHPQMVPTSGDFINLNKLTRKWGFLTTFAISTDTIAGTELTHLPVKPVSPISLNFLTGSYYLNPLTGISGSYVYWRGSLEFKFIVVKAGPHSLRLRISNCPTNIKSDKGQDFQSEVYDFQERTEVNHVVPYMSPIPLTRTIYNVITGNGEFNTYSAGYLRIYLESKLISMSSVANAIDVIVLVRAGEDFELAVPQPLPWTQLQTTPTVELESQSEERTDSGDVVQLGNNAKNSISELITGEQFKLESVVRRFERVYEQSGVPVTDYMLFEFDVNFGSFESRIIGNRFNLITFLHDSFRFSKGSLNYFIKFDCANTEFKLHVLFSQEPSNPITQPKFSSISVADYNTMLGKTLFAHDIITTNNSSLSITVPFYSPCRYLLNGINPNSSADLFIANSPYRTGRISVLISTIKQNTSQSLNATIFRSMGGDADMYTYQGYPLVRMPGAIANVNVTDATANPAPSETLLDAQDERKEKVFDFLDALIMRYSCSNRTQKVVLAKSIKKLSKCFPKDLDAQVDPNQRVKSLLEKANELYELYNSERLTARDLVQRIDELRKDLDVEDNDEFYCFEYLTALIELAEAEVKKDTRLYKLRKANLLTVARKKPEYLNSESQNFLTKITGIASSVWNSIKRTCAIPGRINNLLDVIDNVADKIKNLSAGFSLKSAMKIIGKTALTGIYIFSIISRIRAIMNPALGYMDKGIFLLSLMSDFGLINMKIAGKLLSLWTTFKMLPGSLDAQADDGSCMMTPEMLDAMTKWSVLVISGFQSLCGLKASKTWSGGVSTLVKDFFYTSNQVSTFLKNNIEMIKEYIYNFMGWEHPELAALASIEQNGANIKAWAKEVLLYTSGQYNDAMMTDNVVKQKIGELYETGKDFITAAMIDRNAFHGINTIFRRISDAYEKVGVVTSGLAANMEPISLWFDGPPGVGKSHCADAIAIKTCEQLDIVFEGDPIFILTPGSRFMDGYSAQPIIRLDDPIAVKGATVMEDFSKLWFALNSCAAYRGEFSHLEEKFKYVVPKVIITTANSAYACPSNIADKNAFLRRRDLLVRVELADDLKAKYPGIVDCNDLRLTSEDMEGYKHLKFGIYSSPIKEQTAETITEWYNFNTLVQEQIPKLKNLYERRLAAAKKRIAAKNSLSAEEASRRVRSAAETSIEEAIADIGDISQNTSNDESLDAQMESDTEYETIYTQGTTEDEEEMPIDPQATTSPSGINLEEHDDCLIGCEGAIDIKTMYTPAEVCRKLRRLPGQRACYHDLINADFQVCPYHKCFTKVYQIGAISHLQRIDCLECTPIKRGINFECCLGTESFKRRYARQIVDRGLILGHDEQFLEELIEERQRREVGKTNYDRVIEKVSKVWNVVSSERFINRVLAVVGIGFIVIVAASMILNAVFLVKSFFFETNEKVGSWSDVLEGQIASSGDLKVRSSERVTKVIGKLSAQNDGSLIKAIYRNRCYLSAIRGKESFHTCALGVAGRYVLVPYHFIKGRVEGADTMKILVFGKDQIGGVVECGLPLQVIRIQDTDLCLVELRNKIPCFKNIVGRFMSKNEANHVGQHCRLIKAGRTNFNGLEVLQLPVERVHMSGSYSTPAQMDFILTGWKYAGGDFGWCGSILIDTRCDKIIGYHTSGKVSDSYGLAQVVCREWFDGFDFGIIQDVIEPIGSDVSTDRAMVQPMGDYVPITKLVDAQAPNLSYKTQIRESTCVGVLTSPVRIPPIVKCPGEPRPGYTALCRAVEKGTSPSGAWPRGDIEAVVNDVKNLILAKAKPIVYPVSRRTFTEGVMGVRGMEFAERLHMNTSPGYPYTCEFPGKKKNFFFNIEENNEGGTLKSVHPRLMELYSLHHSQRLKGIVPNTLYQDFLKDEALKVGKAPRLVNGSPLEHTIECRRYFMDFCSAVQSARLDVGIAIGINTRSIEWTDLVNRLHSVGTDLITGDYSGFGPGLDTELVLACHDIVESWYAEYCPSTDEKDSLVRRVLLEELAFSREVAGDLVVGTLCGSPSGNAYTALINSLVNLMYVRLAWLDVFRGIPELATLSAFNKATYMCVYGDDLIMSVHPSVVDRFNNETLQTAFGKRGIVYTDATKSNPIQKTCLITEATFLKHGFRVHDVRGPSIWLACLEKPMIEDIPNKIRLPCNDFERQSLENCEQAARLAYGWGPDYFNQVVQKLMLYWRQKGKCFVVPSWSQIDDQVYNDKSQDNRWLEDLFASICVN